MVDRTRERGVIEDVDVRVDRDIWWTVNVTIAFSSGASGQVFGGYVIARVDNSDGARLVDRYKRDLFGIFDHHGSILSHECFALRLLNDWNAPIVGLESVETGRVFTAPDWFAANTVHPSHEFMHPLRRELDKADTEVTRVASYLERVKAQRALLEDKFAPWAIERWGKP